MSNLFWRNTTVRETPDIEALRAAVATSLPLLDWRRHGIGCLQAYLREGDDHEVRVHIWHPDIVREGIAGHGDVHDHRFKMTSTVLCGEILHTEAHLMDDPEGEWGVYTVVHAREDIGARYQPAAQNVPGALAKGLRRVNLLARTGLIRTGETYTFDRGAFHRSRTQRLAVTVITKHDQIDKQALIVAKPEPVHAFEVDDDFNALPFIEAAIEALS